MLHAIKIEEDLGLPGGVFRDLLYRVWQRNQTVCPNRRMSHHFSLHEDIAICSPSFILQLLTVCVFQVEVADAKSHACQKLGYTWRDCGVLTTLLGHLRLRGHEVRDRG